MLPDDSDWNGIAQLTGDDSWAAPRMRRYAKRLEDCHHRPVWRALRRLGIDPTGHGWNGWLQTEKPCVLEALGDEEMIDTVARIRAQLLSQPESPLEARLALAVRRRRP